jgi:predicted dehydrogenase
VRDGILCDVASGPGKHAYRGAVIGLGMMGRHHARLLQSSSGSRLPGPSIRTVTASGPCTSPASYSSRSPHCWHRARSTFAVVSVPTELHVPTVKELAGAGVSLLIEKPLAASADEAREIVAACAAAGVQAAVGHVERFNPALQELRRRMLGGQVGRAVHDVHCPQRAVPQPGPGRGGRQGSRDATTSTWSAGSRTPGSPWSPPRRNR